MGQQRTLADLSEDERREAEAWLAAFDRQWNPALLPVRARALPRDRAWSGIALAEMVKIDLQRHWARGSPLRLEAYLEQYRALGNPTECPLSLIQAEYAAQCQFAAAPDVNEYLQRFPGRTEELRECLGERRALPSAALPEIGPTGKHAQPRTAGNAESALPNPFGRYRIERSLGTGGMGSVYLALDTKLERKVALKVARLADGDNTEAVERFHREARALALLDHPGICKVFDADEIDGIHYLTMEYIEGKTLADFVAGQPKLSQWDVAALVARLASALHAAHARGVVHRDLKPSNVMVREANPTVPVIIDFGVVHRKDAQAFRLTRTGQIIGTPHYMAPEQVQGDTKRVGVQCDIYALGVMFYKLLTGCLPFDGSTPIVIIGLILTQVPAPPTQLRPNLDPRLETICLKAMAREIGDRYASMAAFAAALDEVCTQPAADLEGGPSVKPSGPHAPAGGFREGAAMHGARASFSAPVRTGRRHRLRLAIIVGLGSTLTLGGLLAMVRGPSGAGDRPRTVASLHPQTGLPERSVTTRPIDPETITTHVANILFKRVPAGESLMGSRESDALPEERPQHRVRILRPFFLGTTEVTHAQYRAVMGVSPAHFHGSDDLPVEQVSWLDAVSFCNELSRQEGVPPFYRISEGNVAVLDREATGYRLPTEAEWEYACRAGTMTRYSFGNDEEQLDRHAWYDRNSGDQPHSVGKKPANAFGLFDMHGNVWEWCWDGYDPHYYEHSPAADPAGPQLEAAGRVIRGGGWYDRALLARSASRYGCDPGFRRFNVGFRVARSQPGP